MEQPQRLAHRKVRRLSTPTRERGVLGHLANSTPPAYEPNVQLMDHNDQHASAQGDLPRSPTETLSSSTCSAMLGVATTVPFIRKPLSDTGSHAEFHRKETGRSVETLRATGQRRNVTKLFVRKAHRTSRRHWRNNTGKRSVSALKRRKLLLIRQLR